MGTNRLTRPGFDRLTDGIYEMVCQAAEVVYRPSGNSVMVNAAFTNTDGNQLDASISVLADWASGAPFQQILLLGDCMPEPNDDFDPEQLVGLTFDVEIKVTTKNGRYYPNIVDVWLPEDGEE